MPRIPTLNPSVSATPANVPSPVSAPAVPGASGADVNEANIRMGQAVINAAEVGKRAVLAVHARNEEQNALDAQTSLQQDIQNTLFNEEPDENGVPKGFLNRQLKQAQGSTLQFDQIAPALKEKYAGAVTGMDQSLQLQKAIDVHLASARDQIIRHESDQNQLDYKQSLVATMKSYEDDAATTDNPLVLADKIKLAQASLIGGYHHLGASDAVIAEKADETAKNMVVNAVQPILETDPARAMSFFRSMKDHLDPKDAADIEKGIMIQTRQFEQLQKYQKNQVYDENMRQAMLGMLDKKMSVSEAERLFRTDQITKSDFDILETKLIHPHYLFEQIKSDPTVFNEIRQAQLNQTKSPGELIRMIATNSGPGAALSDFDAKYLTSITNEKPLTPRDRAVDAEASVIRDFGNTHFAETNIFGRPTNQKESAKHVEDLITDFYKRVDSTNAEGDQIPEIGKTVIRDYAKKRYPEIGQLEDIPHVVVDINGKVQRLLNPAQKTRLKGQYRLSKTSNSDQSK